MMKQVFNGTQFSFQSASSSVKFYKFLYFLSPSSSSIHHSVIEGNGGLGDTAVVPEELFGSEQTLGLVLNIGPSLMCLQTYQGGLRALTAVDCIQCGAKQDDGEEMVFCASCFVLLHRRCSQLHGETVIVCPRCEGHSSDPDPE